MEQAIAVIGHDHGPVTVVDLSLMCGRGRGMGGERDRVKFGRIRVGGRGGTPHSAVLVRPDSRGDVPHRHTTVVSEAAHSRH